jgi:hypothetical protein
MTRKLTNWTYFLIVLNILFLVTPISIYGYYSDTIFLIVTLIFICLTIYQRVKNKANKTITIFFIFCLISFGFIVYQTFDFHFWGPVKTGTVKSIEEENKKSNLIKKRVYYRLNENDTVGPNECMYWEKASLKHFPIFEWMLLKNYNSCGEIEELK